MSDCEDFYRERDRRTRDLIGSTKPLLTPVGVSVGPRAAETLTGQVAAAALIELVARLHRTVRIDVPDVSVALPYGTEQSTLPDHLIALADAIDPCGDHQIGSVRDLPSVVVGDGHGSRYLSAIGATGATGTASGAWCDGTASLVGAAVAACLGAADLLHIVSRRPTRDVSLSLWDCTEATTWTGPSTVGNVDVGDVAVAGAGAVASALAYWLRTFGVTGHWQFIDADIVKVHNTNRSMLFLPEHAGWPNGQPEKKALIVASAIGADHVDRWYHEAMPGTEFDLVLPLANEFDVRHYIGQRGDPLVVHATTGRDWESQLHRHIPGRDDCIDCRFKDIRPAAFECSTAVSAPVEDPAGSAPDATLPFLSAGAGLLLAASLQRLTEEGHWPTTSNEWGWRWLGGKSPLRAGTRSCAPTCRSHVSPQIVREGSADQRWRRLLDP